MRSLEAIYTWHNQEVAGQTMHGVEQAFDDFHPFVNIGDKNPLWFETTAEEVMVE